MVWKWTYPVLLGKAGGVRSHWHRLLDDARTLILDRAFGHSRHFGHDNGLLGHSVWLGRIVLSDYRSSNGCRGLLAVLTRQSTSLANVLLLGLAGQVQGGLPYIVGRRLLDANSPSD
jgi:hypothetical protein